MPSFVNIAGQRFARLTVLSRAENTDRRVFWRVKCDCGATLTARGDHLKSGHTQSCGCAHEDWIAKGQIGDLNRTHGMCGTPEYKAFLGAKDRCSNPRHVNWHGRGIRFLFNSFEEFLAEVGRRPSHIHSIDRQNNDGDYAPGNVRWATPKEQASNRRERARA